MKFKDTEIALVAAAAAATWIIGADWIAPVGIVALWLIFKLVSLGDSIPVLFLALTFQWMQVTVGVYYAAFTERRMPTMASTEYHPIVLLGLVWVLMIAVGVRIGHLMVGRRIAVSSARVDHLCTGPTLLAAFAVSLIAEGIAVPLSFQYPSIRNIIITLTIIRLALLFLILRRLSHPVIRWHLFLLVVAFEVALGFSGFFAGFREPLIFAVMALLEGFTLKDRRRLAVLAVLIAAMAAASVVWMGIRARFRAEQDAEFAIVATQTGRLSRAFSLSSAFAGQDFQTIMETADDLIDRLWTVYYPALVLQRVPAILPHTNGALFHAAIVHVVTPRVFFPDKPELPSDSDMVRKYTGLYVAGRESGTSIAFGAIAESYVDFGIPFMFVPPFLFGLMAGAVYTLFARTIRHRELAAGTITVIFWVSLYLFERSWAKTLGDTVGLFVYLGIPVVIFDRLLSGRRAPAQRQAAAAPAVTLYFPQDGVGGA